MYAPVTKEVFSLGFLPTWLTRFLQENLWTLLDFSIFSSEIASEVITGNMYFSKFS